MLAENEMIGDLSGGANSNVGAAMYVIPNSFCRDARFGTNSMVYRCCYKR
jgi:hypothetical protein